VHDDITDTILALVATKTHGFSGREIEKLFVAVQSAAYAHNAQLNAQILMQVVHHKIEEHKKRGFILHQSTEDKQKQECQQDQQEINDIIQRMNAADGFLSEFYAGKLHHRSGDDHEVQSHPLPPPITGNNDDDQQKNDR